MSNQDLDDKLDSGEIQDEMFEHHRFVVDLGQGATRIDKYLVDKTINASRTKIQSAASAGNILVNDNPVKSNYKVKPNDVISIVMAYPPHETELIPEDIPLNIVYEDNDVLVINKEAGMVVHPGHGNYTGTLVNALAYRMKDEPLFQKGEMRPGLVHRIDKNTSGILVVGKNELALNFLAKQFFDKTTLRAYYALVWGDMEEEEGTITGHIGRSLKDRTKQDVFPEGDYGKPAVTHYKVVKRLGYVNLLECKLETGRTHQIRAHMAHIRHPLFNDEKYGGAAIVKGTTFTKYKQFVNNGFKLLKGHALHAKTLGFVHPTTKKEMFFEVEPPSEFQELIDKWESYLENRISE